MSSSNQSVLERLFNLNANQTNVRTEIMAGVTTFLAMCYIIIVNPLILGETGMDMGAVFVATCIASAIGCFVMGFVGNYPIPPCWRWQALSWWLHLATSALKALSSLPF